MSLRVRLVLVIVALVTLVAAALSVLHLDALINSLSEDALQRSDLVSQQVKSYVVQKVNEVSSDYVAPSNVDETIALWNQIVTSDSDIARMLKLLTNSQGVVEIN